MEARDEETGQGMPDKQLRDEVVTIFVAGHETTAVAADLGVLPAVCSTRTWKPSCTPSWTEVLAGRTPGRRTCPTCATPA